MASSGQEASRRRRSTLTIAKGLQSEKILEEPSLEAIAAKQSLADRPDADRSNRPNAQALSATELAELREIFDLVDLNGDGIVSQNDVGILMRTLGIEVTPARLEKLISDTVGQPDGSNTSLHTTSNASTKNKDRINFSEFVEAMSRSISGRYAPSKVKWAFNKLALFKHPERHVQAVKCPPVSDTITAPSANSATAALSNADKGSRSNRTSSARRPSLSAMNTILGTTSGTAAPQPNAPRSARGSISAGRRGSVQQGANIGANGTVLPYSLVEKLPENTTIQIQKLMEALTECGDPAQRLSYEDASAMIRDVFPHQQSEQMLDYSKFVDLLYSA